MRCLVDNYAAELERILVFADESWMDCGEGLQIVTACPVEVVFGEEVKWSEQCLLVADAFGVDPGGGVVELDLVNSAVSQ
jgi:hypothetical protein